MKRVIGWIGMTLSLSGVAIQSLHPQWIKYTFLIFLCSASMWFVNGLVTRNRPLACTQFVLIVLNIIAVIRWFT
jgi:hypothetical protein